MRQLNIPILGLFVTVVLNLRMRSHEPSVRRRLCNMIRDTFSIRVTGIHKNTF